MSHDFALLCSSTFQKVKQIKSFKLYPIVNKQNILSRKEITKGNESPIYRREIYMSNEHIENTQPH